MSQTIEPIAPATTMPEREWIRVQQAADWCGLCRTTIYNLMDAGDVKFASLRKRGQVKGTRLVHFPSLRDFLESKAEGGAK